MRPTVPITLFPWGGGGAAWAGAAAGLVWLWPVVSDQFAAVARSLTAPAAPAAGGPTLALFSIAIIATLSAALALFETWAGE